LKQYLRDVSFFLQRSEAESAEAEMFMAGIRNFISETEKQAKELSKETEDLWARWDKVVQKNKVMNEKMALIDPLIDRLHTFFGTTPNVIPEPPDDATFEEKIAFYEDLQQKVEQDPNYLRSIQPELTGRSASQTQNTGFIHTLQNADNQKLDTTDFQKYAQSQITSLRTTLEEQYFDVLVTPSLTTEEFDQYFPTQKARQNLKRRTSEIQKAVVSKIRKLVSELPNATTDQKQEFTRKLVRQNFDKDFADAILSELVKSDR